MNNKLPSVVYCLDIDSCSTNKIEKKQINDYYILRYNKLGMCFNDYKNMIYRSVVFSYPEKRVLSFSPIKSIPVSTFMQKYPEVDDNLIVNEYIDGIMINLFYDDRIKKWKIATKGRIGGNYGLYNTGNNETIYDMFLDALRANKDESLNKLQLLTVLPKCLSYTFILQYPKAIIAMNIETPKIYLVSVFIINSQQNQAEYVPSIFYEKWPEFHNVQGIINFPKRFNVSTYGEILNTDIIAGFIITNIETGEHCRILSKTYESLKKTIRIDATVEYQYFCIRRIGKIKEFLLQFPRYKKDFFNIQNEYEIFISNVHHEYCNYYIYKTSEHVDAKYFTHIYKIHHTIYLPSIKTTTKKIYKKTVREYFDKMEPRELLFIMSYDKRNLSNI